MPEIDIIARIRKLLALSTSSNVNEAAAAAAAAAKLMAKHQIDEAEIALSEAKPATVVGEEVLEEHKQRTAWRIRIASALAKANSAAVYSRRLGRAHSVRIVGTADSVTIVRYMLGYLTSEVERLREKEKPSGVTAAWTNAYRLGAATELSHRIKESADAVMREAKSEGKGAALAVIDNKLALVKAALPKLKSSAPVHMSSADGYASGQRAAKTIALSGHRGLGKGTASLTK